MPEYDFALTFEFTNKEIDPRIYGDQLYEAGCDDALLGVGQKGSISLDFIREADSAYDAISSAVENVKSVIPDATLVQVSPDIVGVKDLALIFDSTRQNIQQFVTTEGFPHPINKQAQSLWYLETVIKWFVDNGHDISQPLIDVAKWARHINLNINNNSANPELLKKAKLLVKI